MSMRMRALASAFLLIILAACVGSDSPTTPAAEPAASPPNAALLGGLLGDDNHDDDDKIGSAVGSILSMLDPFACTTSGYGSVTRTVGPSGAFIVIGPHSLAIPPGALSSPTTITATAPAGSSLRIDFEPHNLQFSRNTVLTFSYAECTLPPLVPRIVYVDNLLNPLEILPTLNLTFSKTVHAKVKHFSGYMVWE